MQQLTAERSVPALPPLEALVLDANDLPDFRRLFAGADRATNEAVAGRAEEPERQLRRLRSWRRIDGYAVRFVRGEAASAVQPIVVDSSASRFETCAGAMQALMDETAFPNGPGASRLFPRNIADNTECLHVVFEEDGVQFALYRVDFRVGTVLGSLGVVWRWPHGGPLQALKLAERQAVRMRTACRMPAARQNSTALRAGVQPLSPSAEREQRELRFLREA